jgi:hypothetical protein
MAGDSATQGGFAAAYGRLRADPSFQFGFSAPPPTPRPPNWLIRALKAIGEMLHAASPVIRIAVWALLAAGVLLLVVVVWRQASGRARTAAAAPLNLHALGEAANKAAARAAARLAEADRLAGQGRYGEAIHMLLLTGVDEVERGRPGRIRPSFTSRDIAALPELPAEPRAAFARIASVVERALFGGREVDATAWRDCREAYGALVRPEAWAPGAAA